MLDAVEPPTSSVTPATQASWARSPPIWFTKLVVALAVGPVDGMTWMTAVWFCRAAGLALTTPGTLASRLVMPASCSSFPLVTGSATTSRGPL